VASSPLEPHAVTPAELVERNAAARRGTPFLVYLDGDGRQVIVDLAAGEAVVVGRQPGSDVCLEWDGAVSRVHARLERVGGHWTVVDDGLSRHGTYLRGERIDGRRRLADGDLIGVGHCVLAFCDPLTAVPATTAPVMTAVTPAAALTPAQRRVLVELCRPLLDGSGAGPAGNPRIAEALVVTVDAVKHRLGELYDGFGLNKLPQNEKRAALAAAAVRVGLVTRRDL
jgi:FHA domain-containing protein